MSDSINEFKNEWKDYVIKGDIKTFSHDCELKSKDQIGSGRDCKKLKGMKHCFSGSDTSDV